MRRILVTLYCLSFCFLSLTAQNRWKMEEDGGITWTVEENDEHTDHIEMSGKQVSVILTYGTDAQGELVSNKLMIFPMLRTIPNDTHAHSMYMFGKEASPQIRINNRDIREKVKSFYLKGYLKSITDAGNKVTITRNFFPSTEGPLAIEEVIIQNDDIKEITVEIEDSKKITRSSKEKSVYDIYELKAASQGAGVYKIQPGDKVRFSVIYSGRKVSSPQLGKVDIDSEWAKRSDFTDNMFRNIRFVSPEPVLDRMFDFAKIRAMESIYETKAGLVHGPGGSRYYAAIWANDQAEYANPFFAYTGYPVAIESAMVSWEWFAKWMNPEYKPIPSSIVAEGDDYWNGAGDRGDQAMIAYGATRFALALGDKEKAKEIWPLIEWCLEYCRRQVNANGVVASDSDELENRFPSGDANLCTSSLYYDALVSAVDLGKEIGISRKQLNEYNQQAMRLYRNINSFFGANVQGFETYRYYEGNDILRSWICVPLTVNIFDRAQGTIDALFSPYLWSKDGLLTQAGDNTFWDRSTLYGLRGAFAAGATDKALPFFIDYSNRRLLGDHVPYAVEAWPEGNQRHLSAESALYCRTVTEGLFGFRPTGLRQFVIAPQLPDTWDKMEIHNMITCGHSIDIRVKRINNNIKTEVYANGKLVKTQTGRKGQPVSVKLP